MKTGKAMLTSNTCEWTTPAHIFRQLDDEFHFTLDPCSSHENAPFASMIVIFRRKQ